MMRVNKHPFGFPLNTLMEGMTDATIGSDISVRGISADSRVVKEDDLFLACRGPNTHGGLFVRDAIKAGATAVAIDEKLVIDLDRCRPLVFPVRDLQEKLGLIAGRFYGEPSSRLRLTGVTGTNGKTSVTYWLGKIYSLLTDRQPGLIGTLGYGRYPALKPGINTTPGSIALQSLFADLVEEDVDTVFMEVSSHALAQGRVNGADFDVAVFTNLSRDHLDYHKDVQDYFQAKQKLFSFTSLQAAVVNYDDEYGREIIRRLPANVETISYSISGNHGRSPDSIHPVVKADLAITTSGAVSLDIVSPWGSGQVQTGVTGRFNGANLLVVVSVLGQAGFPLDEILEKMHGIGPAPGRMENFSRDDGATIVVDYAHSPAAMEQALASLREFCDGRLICVFGCGGERDKAKRPQMGKLAEKLSDEVILTDDNPRNETADDIINAILSGISDKECAVIERNRSRAIEMAFDKAGPDDVIFIAGKGHETSQEIAGTRYPFNDRQQVRSLLGNTG